MSLSVAPTPTVTITAEASASSIVASPEPSLSETFDRGAQSLDDPASPWVVVNKLRPLLPIDWKPDDLVPLTGIAGGAGQTLRAEPAQALHLLVEAAAADGIAVRVSTAYRSYGHQQSLFADYASRDSIDRVERYSARPGYSEHQTGLVVDVYDTAACRLRVCFGDSDAGQWVAMHSDEFGFVIRYPDGAQDITGFMYEPWHLRYVGVDLAAEMTGAEVTMEEFFDLPAAPEYD